MPLFKRPNADYRPQKNLPNHNVFQKLASENKPLPSRLLDAVMNYIMDALNTLSDALDKAKAGVFPGSDSMDNKDKIIYSDGMTGKWGKILGTFMDPQTITSREIRDREVKKGKIDIGAVGEDELNDDAVTPPKVPANSFPFSKFVKPQTASVIGGTTTNGGSWYELTLGDYQIASKKSDNNGVTAMTLNVIWSNTAATFDGGKLTNNSVDINKLISPQCSGVIASTTTQNTFFVLPLTPWQLACRTNTSGGPTAQTLDVIWVNTVATFDGAKITPGSLTGTHIQDKSVPLSKIQSQGPVAPFALASVKSDGTFLKAFNIFSITKNGTGLYRVAFTQAASSADAVVQATTNDGKGVNTVLSDQSTQAIVVRLMNLNGQNVDGGFDLVVYDW